MLKVVEHYHWSPFDIEKLFLDNLDMYGLFYWEDVVNIIIDKNTKKSKK